MAAAALVEIGIGSTLTEKTPTMPALSDVNESDADLYVKFKKTEAYLKHLKVQEEYIKEETRYLEKELLHAQEEVKRIQSVPLVIGQFLEPIDQAYGIVGSTTGSLMLLVEVIKCCRLESLRAHPVDARPRTAEGGQQRGAAQVQQRARRHSAAGGRFVHRHAASRFVV